MRYMIRYSEIGLKSRPVRTRMVNLLKRNILDHLETAGMAGKVRSDGGHLYLLTDEPADRILERTFGIRSFSMTEDTSDDPEEISKLALEMSADFDGPFAVRARRTGTHDYTSMELAARIGADIVEEHGLKVDLTNPNDILYIEVRGNQSYLYTDKVDGLGGYPLGSQKQLAALINDDNGLAAAWMMMRRGCPVVAFGEAGRAEPLRAWDRRLRIEEGGIEEAEAMVRKGKAKGLVLGKTSQNVKAVTGISTDIPVYTPLISVDDPEAVLMRVMDPPVLP